MKICLVNSLYHPYSHGGAERSVQFLAESLLSCGHKPIVVTLGEGESLQEINGVVVYTIRLANLYWPFRDITSKRLIKPIWHVVDSFNPVMARKVARILEIEKPDIVHCNNLGGFSVAIWLEIKKRNIPLVHTLRDYYLLCPRTSMFKNARNCEKQCLICSIYSMPKKMLSSAVDCVVGISEFILHKHLDFGLFPSAKRFTVHNSYGSNSIIRKINTSSDRLTFGYIGRIHSSKGVEDVLEAFISLSPSKTAFVVAGKGDAQYVSFLRERYNTENISFIGHVAPEIYYQQVDVSIVPSLWHEPLGRTVLESYAFGVPVIGSNRGGIPEIIDEGKTGFIFDPANTTSLLLKMRLFAENVDLHQELRDGCLEKAKQFLPARIATQYLDIYNKASRDK